MSRKYACKPTQQTQLPAQGTNGLDMNGDNATVSHAEPRSIHNVPSMTAYMHSEAALQHGRERRGIRRHRC